MHPITLILSLILVGVTTFFIVAIPLLTYLHKRFGTRLTLEERRARWLTATANARKAKAARDRISRDYERMWEDELFDLA